MKTNPMPSEQDNAKSETSEILLKNSGEFQIVYERYHLSVFRFIFGLHGGPIEDVEDLTTTTFLRAWKSRHRFQGNMDSVLGWLLKIARNLVIDQFRLRKNRAEPIYMEMHIIPANELTPEEKVCQNEQVTTLWHVLETFSRQKREIIVLRYILGWRVKAFAEYLGINENNVSVTMRRTLKRIQNEWPKE